MNNELRLFFSFICSTRLLDEYDVGEYKEEEKNMPHTNYPYGQLKGKTYYADKDDLYPIMKDHLNKPVTLQTKDGYSHHGYVQHLDNENVYLGVPNNVPGAGGVQPGYPGYPQQPGYPTQPQYPQQQQYQPNVPYQPYAPTQPYGGYPNATPYMNTPYPNYRDDEGSNGNGSREGSDQRIIGGFGAGYGGYAPGFGGYGPYGGYGPGYGGYGPGYGGYGGYGPGYGYGGLSSLVFPLATLAALSV
jgi:hypothetical protein